MKSTDLLAETANKAVSRRNFLAYSGTAALGLVILSSCKKKTTTVDPPVTTDDRVNLGSGDTGILNYAYALEQLEAAFYTKVVAGGYFGTANVEEKKILQDIKDHEVAHRDFFKKALGTGAIQDLEVNFDNIDFGKRESVLMTAMAFEDLGVSAYNGAGGLLQNGDFLLAAGKIVSVEARHAAAIRSLLSPKSASFAGDDTVDANGLDVMRKPADVLMIAKDYLKTKLNGDNLPK